MYFSNCHLGINTGALMYYDFSFSRISTGEKRKESNNLNDIVNVPAMEYFPVYFSSTNKCTPTIKENYLLNHQSNLNNEALLYCMLLIFLNIHFLNAR